MKHPSWSVALTCYMEIIGVWITSSSAATNDHVRVIHFFRFLNSASTATGSHDFFKNGVNNSMGNGMIVVVLRSLAISPMVCR
jgi:hypothetical protein